MRRVNYAPYLGFACALFSVMSLSTERAEQLRSGSVGLVSPLWDRVHLAKCWLASSLTSSAPHPEEKEALRRENEQLRAQVEKMREWLLFEGRIDEQWERLNALGTHQEGELFWKEFFRRRSEQLAERIDLQLQSLPARVIFREPSSWSSALWINVGERDNEPLGRQVVAKNSPVLAGGALVGIVEQVDRARSRVRLISDPRLVPAVRAVRGGEQDRALLEQLDTLLRNLELREELLTDALAEHLLSLRKQLEENSSTCFLAKGELFGSSEQSMRTHSQTLRGVGFNYDFGDDEGPGRDLRRGGILREGDLLVTSGLDGFFPPGLHVGIVSKIEQLREGATSYTLEARASAGNLHELTHLQVLPPLD